MLFYKPMLRPVRINNLSILKWLQMLSETINMIKQWKHEKVQQYFIYLYLLQYFYIFTFSAYLLKNLLSYDIVSESVIKPCIKNDNPLVD